jgi:hypothetical protein
MDSPVGKPWIKARQPIVKVQKMTNTIAAIHTAEGVGEALVDVGIR